MDNNLDIEKFASDIISQNSNLGSIWEFLNSLRQSLGEKLKLKFDVFPIKVQNRELEYSFVVELEKYNFKTELFSFSIPSTFYPIKIKSGNSYSCSNIEDFKKNIISILKDDHVASILKQLSFLVYH